MPKKVKVQDGKNKIWGGKENWDNPSNHPKQKNKIYGGIEHWNDSTSLYSKRKRKITI